jgi:hypothetical protein
VRIALTLPSCIRNKRLHATAQAADLSLNVALINSTIALPDTIGLRGNGKIGKVNRKAVSGADRCLCFDVGGVHSNAQPAINTAVTAIADDAGAAPAEKGA